MKPTKKCRSEDKSPFIFQRDKISFDLKIDVKHQLSERQHEFVNLALDKKTKIMLVKGPAGTAKSFLAIYAGLLCLQQKKVGEIHYLRNPVESTGHNMGFLPGDLDEKINPYLMPLNDKLSELISSEQIKQLNKEKRIHGGSIGFMRGASFNATYISADEAQNFSVADLLLLMTRMGKFSKLILTGDTRQSDIQSSGFETIYNLFDTPEDKTQGIYTFAFGKKDIVREPMIGYILDKFETLGK